MPIPFSYEIISANPQGLTVEYKSTGRETLVIGTHAPRVGESLDAIIQMYAPVAYWEDKEAVRVVPPVGTSGSFTPYVEPPMTFERAKELKLAEIASWRYDKEVNGVTIGGITIKTDPESQAKVNGAFTSLKEGLITAVNWKMANGQFVQLGLNEIRGIAQAMANHVQDCFTAESLLVSLADSATTIEELNAITMPDVVSM